MPSRSTCGIICSSWRSFQSSSNAVMSSFPLKLTEIHRKPCISCIADYVIAIINCCQYLITIFVMISTTNIACCRDAFYINIAYRMPTIRVYFPGIRYLIGIHLHVDVYSLGSCWLCSRTRTSYLYCEGFLFHLMTINEPILLFTISMSNRNCAFLYSCNRSVFIHGSYCFLIRFPGLQIVTAPVFIRRPRNLCCSTNFNCIICSSCGTTHRSFYCLFFLSFLSNCFLIHNREFFILLDYHFIGRNISAYICRSDFSTILVFHAVN